jgi:hypothetical protein
MRHKWMVIMVVMVTTLTTAQEALKQYDSLRAQAATWATSGLWAGFLNSYAQPAEQAPQSFRAQAETCSANQPGQQPQPSDRPALAQTIRIEIVKAERPEQPTRTPRAELLPLTSNHREGRAEASRQLGPTAQEVALLVAARELEATGELVEETAGPIHVLTGGQDGNELELAGHTLRTVRVAGFAPARAQVTEANPLSADLRQTRSDAATRAQAQKVKAMKKALRLLQLQIDRAARQELSRAQRETITGLPYELAMSLVATDEAAGSIAANLPLAPPQPAPLPLSMTGTGASGGCAGE